jgi:3D (Asp-Asp-Asp) domain-containing protein
MTLLLAPFDVLRRPSAMTSNCSGDQGRRRSGKLPHQRRPNFSIVVGRFAWLWTLLAAVLVIVVPALLSNKSALFFGPSVDQDRDKSANETAVEILLDSPYPIEAPRAFALEEESFAPTSLWFDGNILNEAKSLVVSENLALLDALQPTGLPLEHAVKFNLGSLTVTENLSNSGNKAKRRNASLASRLARVTVYWPDEGDFYTRNRKSSTGTRLRDGHCAVDPKVIPYGSVVNVPGVGRLIAVDTGPAVISRRAARLTGRTREQRSAIVIDVFCSTRAKARALTPRLKHFAVVTWQRPDRVAEL